MLEVYFIAGTQDVSTEELPTVLKKALQAGITCFQFREKGKNSLAGKPVRLKEMAKDCQRLCQEYQVPFIVNDSVDLALDIQADGVHVGQNDDPIQQTIKRVERKMIVGYSTNNLDQFLEAEQTQGIDYVGIGPAFLPGSKSDHEPVIGTEGIKEAMDKRRHLPAVAIGGINEQNAEKVWETGVDGLAVVSAIAQSQNYKRTVSKLKNPFENQ